MGYTPTLHPFVGEWDAMDECISPALHMHSKQMLRLLYDLCVITEESSIRGEYDVPAVWSEESGEHYPVLTREAVLSIPVDDTWEWEVKAAWAFVAAMPAGSFVAIESS